MKSDQLKPCPFCGGEAYLGESWDKTKNIQCTVCGCSTVHFKNKLDAVECWNQRVLPEEKDCTEN